MIFANIELPILAVYIVMAVGFIVMVWGAKNLNKKSNARIIMIVGVVMVLGGVGGRFCVSAEKSEDARLDKNAHIFLTAKADMAANYIADRFSDGGTVAFLIDDESYNDSTSDTRFVLDELQKRLGDKGVTLDEVLIVGEMGVDKKTGEERREDPTDATIMKKKLDQVYDKVDIVVNFVGLPGSAADLKKITFLTKKNTAPGKNTMLLMTDTGLPYVEQDMLKKSRVCAIIDYISSAGSEFDMQKNSAPKDLYDAFGLFYYFINADTLDSYIAENPNYFVAK